MDNMKSLKGDERHYRKRIALYRGILRQQKLVQKLSKVASDLYCQVADKSFPSGRPDS